MDIKNTFAGQFAEITLAQNKAAFEVRFDSVQRGLLNQMNEEISNVAADSVQREAASIEKERNAAVERSNRLRDLQTEIKTNSLRFLDIRDLATSLAASDADSSGDLSAEEVSALNAGIAELTEEISKLKFSTAFPEFTDGNLANRMRQELEELTALTAVVGTIDADNVTATNDNRDILAKLTSISDRANTYSESSSILVGGINQVIIDNDKRALDLEADVSLLTQTELVRREEEAARIETQYSNLIRSISLAFEVQSGYADVLTAGSQFEPEPGSILNIFS